MDKNTKYFIERVEEIWNELDLERHQGFTCKYFDEILSYFDNIKEHITYDDVEYKLSEIKGIVNIINPNFKMDLKIFNKLQKELINWQTKIDTLQKIFSKS